MASRSQRKKQYLAQQTGKQKELRQPNAEEYQASIEDAVRKQLPQIVRSISVQEQSVPIGPLPPADEARKYQELLPDFMDRTLTLTEGLQKAGRGLGNTAGAVLLSAGILSKRRVGCGG